MEQDIKPRQQPMPEEMRFLIGDYPRAGWAEHPNFRAATAQWLKAHQMFRDVAMFLREDAEGFLEKDRSAEGYAARLARYGHVLVSSLHGHHTWEDRSFFPELMAADPRFERGLDMLESDHAVLDPLLDDFARAGNRVVQLVQMDEAQAREEAAGVLKAAGQIEALLARHLQDEEELAVPLILHHKLRG